MPPMLLGGLDLGKSLFRGGCTEQLFVLSILCQQVLLCLWFLPKAPSRGQACRNCLTRAVWNAAFASEHYHLFWWRPYLTSRESPPLGGGVKPFGGGWALMPGLVMPRDV